MQNTLLKGLEGFWPLHEVAGIAAQDMLGRYNLSEVGGAIASADGPVVLSRDMELGSVQYFTVADPVELRFGDEYMTLAVWIFMESIAAGAAMGLVTKGTFGNPAEEYWLRHNDVGGQNRFEFGGRGGSTFTRLFSTLGAVSLGVFYFLLMGHDPVSNEIWVRGNYGGIDTVAHTTGIQASTNPLRIGARADGGNVMDGRAAELGLWRRRLTEAEQEWLWNNGDGRTWPFDGRPSPLFVPQRQPRRGVYRVPGPATVFVAT